MRLIEPHSLRQPSILFVAYLMATPHSTDDPMSSPRADSFAARTIPVISVSYTQQSPITVLIE